MRRPCLVVAFLSACLGSAPRPLFAQQVLAQFDCEGSYTGMTLSGGLLVERWMTARSYRYYGIFRDPYGNVYELEVMTPDLAGGTGSTWLNGARHRETFINIRVFEGGFVVRTEDGVIVQYECRPAGD